MATTQSQLDAGLKLADVQANQAGMSSEDIAAKAQSLTAPAPTNTSGSITSDTLSGNTKALTLPPPTTQTLTSGVQDYISSQNQSIKTEQQKQLDADKASLDSQKNDITRLITDIGNSGQIKNDLYRTQGVDAAKKQVDEFTSRLEAEQHSNTRRLEALKKNPEGLFAGGMEAEVNRVNSESLTKQADLAILQNNALRRYSTAAEIADRAVEAKLEPMKAKLEALKFFYAENKADFDKKDDRAYAELIKQKERDYVTQKENVTKAFASGLRTSYINENGKIYRASDGKEYPDAQSFLADAGVTSFEEAYQKGLVGDLTYERVADMDFVSQLRVKYPDAGISITDSAASAAAKVRDNSYIYGKETYMEAPAGGNTPDITKIGDGSYIWDEETQTYVDASNFIDNGANGASPAAQADKFQTEKTINQIATLQKNSGLNSVVGPNAIARWSIKNSLTGASAAAIGDIQQITEQLTLDKLIQAKANGATFGALSDGERQMLASAASKIGTWAIKNKDGKVTGYNIDEKTFRKELQTISDMTQKAYNIKYGQTGQTTTDASGNQVKGISIKAQPLPYLSTQTFQPVATKQGGVSIAPVVSKIFPPGSVGGQCGDFVRKVATKLGATYPTLGDSLKSKTAAVMKYGTSLSKATIGSVIVTKENPTYGHVAYIIGKNASGWIVAESNYKQSNKVSYGRVIPFNSPKVIGVINPTNKIG